MEVSNQIMGGLIGAIAFFFNSLSYASSPREIAQIAKQTTVRIVNENSSGSGVIVAGEEETYWVLTCSHIVQSASESYQIRTQNGKRFSLVYSQIKQLNEVNLAVVPFQSSNNLATAIIGDSTQLVEGDPVYVSGFPVPANHRDPELDEFQFTNGIISSLLNPTRSGGYGFTHTSLTYTGMGGAPIFNSEGQLVGIHCGGDRDPNNLAFKTGFNWGIPIHSFIQLAEQMNLSFNFFFPSPESPNDTDNSHLPDVFIENSTENPNESIW
ncbi:MAG: serine protease [Oscillatoria sp. PMC 1051.18]|nr:serine protease [Oscillatoria sp. PMC 1050.18]MEC5029240.1 serine protease [Oscillatoria sp. PMC 1051.18]